MHYHTRDSQCPPLCGLLLPPAMQTTRKLLSARFSDASSARNVGSRVHRVSHGTMRVAQPGGQVVGTTPPGGDGGQ